MTSKHKKVGSTVSMCIYGVTRERDLQTSIVITVFLFLFDNQVDILLNFKFIVLHVDVIRLEKMTKPYFHAKLNEE